MKWFKHDSNASRDVKLRKLMMNYGMEGYGLYWYCLEEIANAVSVEKYTFELESDAEIISHDTGISQKKIQEMMTFMVNIGLFEETCGVITCMKMIKRLDSSMTGNPEMRKIIGLAKKNHDMVMKNHDSIMTKSEQIRLDEIRLDKNPTGGFEAELNEIVDKMQSKVTKLLPRIDEQLYKIEAFKWVENRLKKGRVQDLNLSLVNWMQKARIDENGTRQNHGRHQDTGSGKPRISDGSGPCDID